MDLFSDLISTVQSDLTIGSESTLFPPTIVKLAINRSYRKAGGLFLWPETEDAKKTSTQEGQEYYTYPDTWQPDSVWKLKVDGVRYGDEPDGSPTAYPDYLLWREDEPTSTDKRWATQWRRYFISPVPTTTGNNNIEVWGQKVVDLLVNDSDTTIFSYSLPHCNEAVVLEAVAILKNKGEEEKPGAFRSAEAKQILAVAFEKIRKAQAKYEKTQPFFAVPDFFKRNAVKTKIGDF